MLDLNYVRENLEQVRTALATRGVVPESLDHFAAADAERRRIIAESDQLNAERNVSSREIGALMKEGKREEAEARQKAYRKQQNLEKALTEPLSEVLEGEEVLKMLENDNPGPVLPGLVKRARKVTAEDLNKIF